jgi:L-seryl-tRNA(Ser) seleniumtransferase
MQQREMRRPWPAWDNLFVKTAAASELFRTLPSVDEVMRIPAVSALTASDGHASVVDAARVVLASLRQEITTGLLDGDALELALSGLAGAVEKQLRHALSYSLRSVINATGVILHTNLGRAPLSEAVIEHIRGTGASYSNLEFDLAAGARGKRDVHVDRLFRRVLSDALGAAAQTNAAGLRPGATAEAAVSTRAETATIVVNNNAAAVLLALNTLAEGGEVIVSRGELVEIGGSFRIPDVMAKSGAILCEVGTTNRTRVSDYAQAITERTRLLLRVHRSNFEITGFTEQASTAELVALAGKRGIPLMEDLGSGALFDLRSVGINGEQGVLDSLRSGVDIVTYSGDKLLGGPQAGLISGRSELIARMRLNSLFRALRVDKLIYAALEATLLAYIRRDHDAIPTLRMMHLTKEAIGERARKMAARIVTPKVKVELVDGESILGGGAAPSSVLPTIVLALTCDGLSADELATRLRGSDPPIIARVDEGRVLLDLRTVFPEQDVALAVVIGRVVA